MALIREIESRNILFIDRSQAHRISRRGEGGIFQKARKVCRGPNICFSVFYIKMTWKRHIFKEFRVLCLYLGKCITIH
jgi:hypothetical protein